MESITSHATPIKQEKTERNKDLNLFLDVGLAVGAILVVINIISDGVIFYTISSLIMALNDILLPLSIALFPLSTIGVAICILIGIVMLMDVSYLVYLSLKK